MNTSDATAASERDSSHVARWLSTSQAAAALRCSERTIQRRAKSGELTARKVATPDGEKWEIQLSAATGAEGAAKAVPTGDAIGAATFHAQNREGADSADKVTPAVAPQVPTGADTSDRCELEAMRAQLVEQLKGENQFLRAALEQRDRDAAELRAALRKALEIAPRQLAQGTDDAATPTNAATIEPQQSAQTGAATNVPNSAPDAAKSQAERQARPLWKVVLGIR